MTAERSGSAGAERLVHKAETPRSGGPVDRGALEDLAAASRILADQGVFDAAGHFSMRHPHHPERFFMSRSLAPALVTVADIMEFDLAGMGCDARLGFLERFIHAEGRDAAPLHQPAFEVETVDTLGAGDAFAAGLAVSLVEGHGWALALRRAAACGALATRKIGVFDALPTRDELENFLKP
jgi:hypothetical protein